MTDNLDKFIKQSTSIISSNKDKFKSVHNIINKDIRTDRALSVFTNPNKLKAYAHSVKKNAIDNLDSFLLQFEEVFTKNGGEIIWAKNADEACEKILEVFKNNSCNSFIKGHSSTLKEIDIVNYLHKNNINNTDKEDFDRGENRKIYRKSEVVITGVNFLVADTGSVCVAENEGNIGMGSSFAKVHIAVSGIEKIIPSIYDLSLFLSLLSTHSSGQQLTVFNTIFGGPRKDGELDGPNKMILVLLDNGRTKLLADENLREALYCIRCGACQSICPVAQIIGSDTYGTTYTGPIGSVIEPHYKGMENYGHLSFASSLCGKCTDICPVNIPIHNMLRYNRKLFVDKGFSSSSEKTMWSYWRSYMDNNKILKLFSSANSVKKMVFDYLVKDGFGNRDFPSFTKNTFSNQYKTKK